MSQPVETLLFIKHPDQVANSYELSVQQFLGLIISAQEEDIVLTPYPEELESLSIRCPERYAKALKAAEVSLSRGFPEQGHYRADLETGLATVTSIMPFEKSYNLETPDQLVNPAA